MKNSGTRDGNEVVQVYVRPLSLKVERPFQELKAFERVLLHKGEMANVTFDLNERSFAYYDVESHSWKADPGKYEIRVGSSSRDIRLKTVVEKP